MQLKVLFIIITFLKEPPGEEALAGEGDAGDGHVDVQDVDQVSQVQVSKAIFPSFAFQDRILLYMLLVIPKYRR